MYNDVRYYMTRPALGTEQVSHIFRYVTPFLPLPFRNIRPAAITIPAGWMEISDNLFKWLMTAPPTTKNKQIHNAASYILSCTTTKIIRI